MEKGEKKLAREKFNRVVSKLNPHQAYARLFLANIDLEGAQTMRNKEGRNKCIQNANGVYEGILTRRSYNMYAANGIGEYILFDTVEICANVEWNVSRVDWFEGGIPDASEADNGTHQRGVGFVRHARGVDQSSAPFNSGQTIRYRRVSLRTGT